MEQLPKYIVDQGQPAVCKDAFSLEQAADASKDHDKAQGQPLGKPKKGVGHSLYACGDLHHAKEQGLDAIHDTVQTWTRYRERDKKATAITGR